MATRVDTEWPDHLALVAAGGASNAAGLLARLAAEEPPGRLLDFVSVQKKENS